MSGLIVRAAPDLRAYRRIVVAFGGVKEGPTALSRLDRLRDEIFEPDGKRGEAIDRLVASR